MSDDPSEFAQNGIGRVHGEGRREGYGEGDDDCVMFDRPKAKPNTMSDTFFANFAETKTGVDFAGGLRSTPRDVLYRGVQEQVQARGYFYKGFGKILNSLSSFECSSSWLQNRKT